MMTAATKAPVTGTHTERRQVLPAAVARLKAVADPARLTMLTMLAERTDALCVCEFQPALAVEQPTVSHHLRVLREAGLVVSKREGSWIYYSLAPETALWIRAVLAGLPR